MSNPGSQTSEILLYQKKLLTATQGLSKNVKWKFLCDFISPLLPDNSHSTCFTKQIFSKVPGSETFQIMLN